MAPSHLRLLRKRQGLYDFAKDKMNTLNKEISATPKHVPKRFSFSIFKHCK